MAFCSDSRKTRHISCDSSGEEDALLQNQSKIVTYGVQQQCPSGVRIYSFSISFLLLEKVLFVMHRRAVC